MRTVNIVNNGVVTNSNVVARVHSVYSNGNKYVPCVLGGKWVNVRAEKVRTVKTNPFSVLA